MSDVRFNQTATYIIHRLRAEFQPHITQGWLSAGGPTDCWVCTFSSLPTTQKEVLCDYCRNSPPPAVFTADEAVAAPGRGVQP